jgi:hypothetical protein
MKLAESKVPKLLIIYLYGVFVLNVIDIFYLNRANSIQSIGFVLTLIIPVFFSRYLARKDFTLTKKSKVWHSFILVVVCPLIFIVHIALTL